MNVRKMLSRGVCGSIMAAIGVLALAACTVDVPEDDGAENIGEVSQALVGEGGWCGPPGWPSCESNLDCCSYDGFPFNQYYCRNLANDDNNCGDCGVVCSGWNDQCIAGVCDHLSE